MKKSVISAVALLLLAGCTANKPGAFERIDEDTTAHTVQYRFDPARVNNDAMQVDLSQYCSERGFDKVDSLPSQDSHIPGLKKTWYQCNYAIKS
ncbi:hypothetical protein J9874_00871 [Duffyella gerundensis]|jgi:hypothetical protein|uniref:membrane lipoprotein lipid attachment site-containing protein n=1 Tax=Duffyella TaxID=3026546 RepID=UPI0016544651|nr:membrane lipoprotein lipid attachment site-containing protein [Duffyella gerundensis]QTO55158.1 membrane lipoprotein lipid attachment site-containing protein [Duffyella gerundensis]UCB30347.1 hypothetical protein J9874_00871 [Duffyella gerundensis]